ncbi:hypothetical protein C4544_06660 [candidate division WS5 bacterium]|uniref:PSP1 C-terminal domain-containing protein n=1 Tax=candidate division WS5 bacterium TaxID=2093353 RepID=A0A419DAB1_9BACT|nr:MAG: hypothetical protein C4544_06660 [candidate division WS5 bacterium]
MTKAIGVQFRSGIKIYDFKQKDDSIEIRDKVLVETAYGEEIGTVRYVGKKVGKSQDTPLKDVQKVLTEKDIDRLKRLKDDHLGYADIFRAKAEEYKLPMKLADFEFSLDGEKVTFYFTADSRVDFRNMVRDMSRQVKKTVLLRQMGQRDEARVLDGFGACGRPICCRSFLMQLENISMDMVREQYEGTRNSSKVSGICGKLMCCLAFENGENKSKGKSQNAK